MTTTQSEIPLIQGAQILSVTLGGIVYQLRITWCAPAQCWMINLFDQAGVLLRGGIPMITGADLLEQFEYLGVPGGLVVASDNDPDAVPTFGSLGVNGRLFFQQSTTP